MIVEGDDRYGEGVNVAARLQQIAEPGGICVSGKVSKEVEKKLAFGFEPMGEHRVKNIAEPILCYRVNLQGITACKRRPREKPSRRPNCLIKSGDRRSALYQHEQRSRAGVLRRRPGRGSHHRSVEGSRADGDRAAFRRSLTRGSRSTSGRWRRILVSVSNRRKRAAGCDSRAHQRADRQGDRRRPSLGRPVRSRPGRCFPPAGRGGGPGRDRPFQRTAVGASCYPSEGDKSRSLRSLCPRAGHGDTIDRGQPRGASASWENRSNSIRFSPTRMPGSA